MPQRAGAGGRVARALDQGAPSPGRPGHRGAMPPAQAAGWRGAGAPGGEQAGSAARRQQAGSCWAANSCATQQPAINDQAAPASSQVQQHAPSTGSKSKASPGGSPPFPLGTRGWRGRAGASHSRAAARSAPGAAPLPARPRSGRRPGPHPLSAPECRPGQRRWPAGAAGLP